MSQATTERAEKRRMEVFSACDELEEAGRQVSIKNVVEAIGGSNSTAGKYIKEWKGRKFLEAPETDPDLYELTKGFRDQAMRLVEDKLRRAEQRAEDAEAKADEAKEATERALLRAEEAEAARAECIFRPIVNTHSGRT